jgi:hypothetical protein
VERGVAYAWWLLEGIIFIAGGNDNGTDLTSILRYDDPSSVGGLTNTDMTQITLANMERYEAEI